MEKSFFILGSSMLTINITLSQEQISCAGKKGRKKVVDTRGNAN